MSQNQEAVYRPTPVEALGVNARARFIVRTYNHLFAAIIGFVLIEVALFKSGVAEVLARGMLGVNWLLVLGGTPSVFGLLVIASKQLTSIALLVFWIAMGDLLHGRQAKRLFAPMMAGVTLGTIVGSFASAPLGRWLGIDMKRKLVSNINIAFQNLLYMPFKLSSDPFYQWLCISWIILSYAVNNSSVNFHLISNIRSFYF